MAQVLAWDVPGAVWDEAGTIWDPPSILGGALRGTGRLAGTIPEPPPGQILAGALRGTGLLTGALPAFAVSIPHIFWDDVLPGSLTVELDENFAALLAVLNAPGRLGVGPLASRPAPGHPGALFVATDSNNEWWIDDGIAWQPMGALAPEGQDLGTSGLVHDRGTNSLRLFGGTVGAGGGRVLAGGKARAIPTEALIDGAVLYVADVQDIPGRAAWHSLAESGHRTPLIGALFRDGAALLANSAVATTTFAHGAPTLTAGTLVGRSLEVWWRGEVTNGSAATQTLTLTLTLGGTALVTVTCASVPINASPVAATALFRVDGLTGAMQRGMALAVSAPGTVTVALAAGALDPTVDQPLDCLAQWGVAHPALSCRTHVLQVRYR